MAASHQAHELVLHLGLAKTGTSSLQNALFSRKTALYDRFRLLYPGDLESHSLLQPAFSAEPTSVLEIQRMRIGDHAAVVRYLREYRQSLLDEVATKRPRRIVISTEYFSALTLGELRAANEFLAPLAKTLTPIVYVRDPWSFSISMTQEMIRDGQLADRVDLGYMKGNAELIDKFSAAFGKQVKVLPFRSANGQFDIVSDFFSHLGIDVRDLVGQRSVRQNRGINREAAFALLQLNNLFPVIGSDGKINHRAARDWVANSIEKIDLPGTPIRHSRAAADAILEASRADMERLQYQYFGGQEVLSEAYQSLNDGGSTGHLSSENVEPTRVYTHLLHAMYALAEMTEVQYTARIYWTAMYYLQSNNIAAAESCFRELLEFPGPHAYKQEAQARLDSIAAQRH